MSISNSLSNALSGMNAASRTAEVVSSNLSNIMTDGYGRRTLTLSAASVGGRGAGVDIGPVNRMVDRGVLADRRLADAGMNRFDFLAGSMKQLQNVVGQVGSGSSISARIAALETSLIDASGDPSSQARLSAVASHLAALTDSLNTASRSVQTMRAEADRSIADQTRTLNTALARVERLNADIAVSRMTGMDPSGLMDQRQTEIDRIAEIVPVRELDRQGGQVALITPSGATLLDGKAREFTFTANPVIVADMTLASGGLSGLSRGGTPLEPDGIGALAGGTLGAAFQLRDVDLAAAQVGLDSVAADLIERFQSPIVDPTLTMGDPGLLTNNGAAIDPLNMVGLAGRISVNAAIDPAQGGEITRLRDGLNATGLGPSGNADLLDGLRSALAAPRLIGSNPSPQSAGGLAASLEADIGNLRLNYESELGFESARWSSFREAEAAGGVDSDYEMQMLLRVEQAYAANARVIQTIESMMRTLMEI